MNSFIFPFPPKSKKTQHKIKEKYHPDATVLAILLANVVVPILVPSDLVPTTTTRWRRLAVAAAVAPASETMVRSQATGSGEPRPQVGWIEQPPTSRWPDLAPCGSEASRRMEGHSRRCRLHPATALAGIVAKVHRPPWPDLVEGRARPPSPGRRCHRYCRFTWRERER